jgi:hypothetical protein
MIKDDACKIANPQKRKTGEKLRKKAAFEPTAAGPDPARLRLDLAPGRFGNLKNVAPADVSANFCSSY